MKKYYFFLCIIFIIIPFVATAHIHLRGNIVDDEGAPVSFAGIMAFQANDSILITSGFSDSIGYFSLEAEVENFPAFLEISGTGYDSRLISLQNASVNLSNIRLRRNMTIVDIDAVTVLAKHSTFSADGDRFTFRIQNAALLKGEHVFNILKLTPLVLADDMGAISIAGQGGAEIYINGRKSRLSGDALQSYLKSLPAEDILSVEVMPVPNSTYRSGNTGIINIQLKQNRYDGYNMSFSFSGIQQRYFSEMANVNLNWHKQKVGLNFSGWFNNLNDYLSRNENTIFTETGNRTESRYVEKGDRQVYGGNFKFDYDINKNQTLGVVVSASFDNTDKTGFTESQYGKAFNTTFDSTYHTLRDISGFGHNIAINLNYQLKTDTLGSTFTVDLDNINYLNSQKNITTNARWQNDQLGDPTSMIFQRKPQDIRIWSGKIEYKYVFRGKETLSVGIDAYTTRSDNDSYTANWMWDNNNPNYTNHFIYRETIGALFASFTKRWSAKWSTTVGVRMEYNYNKGEQKTIDHTFTRDKFKVLPTVYISYTPDKNHNLTYSLSNRLRHPYYSYLNPFRTYYSSTYYQEGNPFLQSANFLMQNLQYLYKRKYVLGLYHTWGDKLFGEFDRFEGENIRIRTYYNYITTRQYGVIIGLYNSYFFNNIMMVNSYVTFNRFESRGRIENESFSSSSNYISGNFMSRFQLSKKQQLSFSVGFTFSSSYRTLNAKIAPNCYVDANIMKVFNNGLSVTIFGSDIFKQRRSKYVTNYAGLRTWSESDTNTQRIGVNLTYRFGKTTIKTTRNRNTSSDAKNRLSE